MIVRDCPYIQNDNCLLYNYNQSCSLQEDCPYKIAHLKQMFLQQIFLALKNIFNSNLIRTLVNITHEFFK